ncbi:MAG: hypothetical protein OXG25_08045 [Gammaproteobacteria bacterium]|nr:hypothetical protein [Gammaproteobacteria bacterium]
MSAVEYVATTQNRPEKRSVDEFPDRFDQPEDAYEGFFRADSAKNAPAWAAVMSYPHVRVSASGNMSRYETPNAYADAADWTSREATGWVRSEGVPPRRLHESVDKVHLLGGWTRFNVDGDPILENRVTYILTRLDGSWGIQARFGVDSYAGHEIEETTVATERLAKQFVTHVAEGDLTACAKLCRLPLTVVHIGNVITATSESDIVELLRSYSGRGINLKRAKAVQTGTRGAVVEVVTEFNDGERESGIVVVGKQHDKWLIAGTSKIAR